MTGPEARCCLCEQPAVSLAPAAAARSPRAAAQCHSSWYVAHTRAACTVHAGWAGSCASCASSSSSGVMWATHPWCRAAATTPCAAWKAVLRPPCPLQSLSNSQAPTSALMNQLLMASCGGLQRPYCAQSCVLWWVQHAWWPAAPALRALATTTTAWQSASSMCSRQSPSLSSASTG